MQDPGWENREEFSRNHPKKTGSFIEHLAPLDPKLKVFRKIPQNGAVKTTPFPKKISRFYSSTAWTGTGAGEGLRSFCILFLSS